MDSIAQQQRGEGGGGHALQDTAWPKHEVRALRRALKDIPSAVDKNERFRRVAALVGGGRSKKDCYDKYKELKAEAKVKRTSNAAPEELGGSSDSRHYSCPPNRATELNNLLVSSGCKSRGDSAGNSHKAQLAPSPRNRLAQPLNEDHFESAASATTTLSPVIGVGDSSSKSNSSALSSRSSYSTELAGEQPQKQRRKPTASSMFSSFASELPDDVVDGYGECDPASATEDRRSGGDLFFDEGEGRGGRCLPTTGSNTTSSSVSTVLAPRATDLETMEVEEVEVEDFCLDDELEQGQGEKMHRESAADCGSTKGQRYHSAPVARGSLGSSAGVGVAVTEMEANGVRELVWGDRSKTFNDAWRYQGFYFCGVDGLGYGLVQAEGGPCGVLAVVQAFLLEGLLFDRSNEGRDWRNPKKSHRQRSLASALSTIIWRAGESTAILAVPDGAASVERSSRYRPDGVTERLKLYRANSRSALEDLVHDHFHHFTEKKGHGVILLVYSCLFTRGLDAVRGDMDNSFGELSTMMARHEYASQELVNLLLVGRAHSNVFDGQRVISEGGGDGAGTGARGEGGREKGDRVVLTGVPRRGRVGFLTLFEAYKHVEVGDRLKMPEIPVWVICSESHYSVLFSPDHPSIVSTPTHVAAAAGSDDGREETGADRRVSGANQPPSAVAWRGAGRGAIEGEGEGEGGAGAGAGAGAGGGCSKPFDLEFYDGLGRQDEVIRLTVDQGQAGGERRPPPPTAGDAAAGALVPPLDLVIRTRWPGAAVDWNGTDPIL